MPYLPVQRPFTENIMSTKQAFRVTCKKKDSSNRAVRKTEPGPPSYAVIKTVAEIKDTEPESLEPLYSIIDPDALDQLFQQTNHDKSSFESGISFSYEGYDVTIKPVGEPTTNVENTAHHE